MKYLSLFSGIGAFEKALDYLNVKYELVNYCEIDKYASMSYSLIHSVSEDMNLGDITKVDTSKLPNDIDLITYGFPCQDITLAGKLKGMFNADGTLTRSGLFFEALRIIETTKPKVAIAENVKNLVSKKFKTEFSIVLKSLEEAGYNNYWQVLNAKDYGVPQNRERVFIVSIRKDIDNGLFKFPEPYELKLRLKDMLEDEFDTKCYLSDEQFNGILADVPNTFDDRVYIKNATLRGYTEAYEGDGVYFVNIKGKRGMVQRNKIQTIKTAKDVAVITHDLKARTLTEKEAFRLMGFEDEVINTLLGKVSNTQLYKQAGNSIVVDVLEEIFVELFKVVNLNVRQSKKMVRAS